MYRLGTWCGTIQNWIYLCLSRKQGDSLRDGQRGRRFWIVDWGKWKQNPAMFSEVRKCWLSPKGHYEYPNDLFLFCAAKRIRFICQTQIHKVVQHIATQRWVTINQRNKKVGRETINMWHEEHSMEIFEKFMWEVWEYQPAMCPGFVWVVLRADRTMLGIWCS